MTKRTKLVVVEEPITPTRTNSYFTSEKPNLQFVSTGCTVLDCALGGGLCLGRTANVVGDKSTAKTGTATEVMINFSRSYPEGAIAYRETEAAWDDGYAEAMGLPIAKIDFGDPESPVETVEQFINDFEAFLDKQLKAKKPGLYILDSLDSLSDDEEMKNDVSKGTYGMAKAKKLGIMFRTLTRKQEKAQVLLLIVSQVRENINAGLFGEKYKRSGGKALDFYASQVFWLARMGNLDRRIDKVERVYGMKIKASVKKNKVALAHREASYTFEFGYGVDDLLASLEWLNEVGQLKVFGLSDTQYKAYKAKIREMPYEEYELDRKKAALAVKQVWAEIDEKFIPKRSKYQ